MSSFVETYRGVVSPEEVDLFGHMSVNFYQPKYTMALPHLYYACGVSMLGLKEAGVALIAVEQTITYIEELHENDLIVIRSAFCRFGSKSLQLRHEMVNLEKEKTCSTMRHTAVMFSLTERQSIPLSGDLRNRFSRHFVES